MMMMKMNNINTAFPLFAILIIILSSTPFSAAVKEVKVGGKYGWSVPPTNQSDFYIQWASSRRFHVGDSLRFEYTNDSVQMVDKWGYYHCNSTNPYSSYRDGYTVVKLETSGPVYFTSGKPEHCKDGQRLEVDVMDHHHFHPITNSPLSIETPAPSPHSAASMNSVMLFSKLILMASIITIASHDFVIS